MAFECEAGLWGEIYARCDIIFIMKTPLIARGKVEIEKLVPGGMALGVLEAPGNADDGKKVFLWNALPGEIVTEIEVRKRKASYLEGVATKIERRSARRVEARDEVFLATSPWQILDYDFELEMKRELVLEALRQEKVEIPEGVRVEEVQTDEKEWFYRNKMEYALFWDREEEKIHLGMHARGSHRKLKMEQSSIERPEIFARATEIIQELNNRGEGARKYQSLLLRANQDGEVSGGLFENHRPHPEFAPLNDEILGKRYNYSPNGFFQINLPVYELVLKEIQKEVGEGRVLDLYSGVGTIGLSVAPEERLGELVLVESDKNAFRELMRNCQGTPAKPYLAKSEDALEFIAREETVILDPPRAGIDRKLAEKLLEVVPRKIIYLSCNPTTQARDVKILSEKYIIRRIIPFNFFPKTPHIENLVVLEIR